MNVKLSKSAFRAIKRSKRGKSVRLTVSGQDSAGARIAASQSLRLLSPEGEEEGLVSTSQAGVAIESRKSYCPLS